MLTRSYPLQDSGLAPVLENPNAPLTVLAPTNQGTALEQLGPFEDVRFLSEPVPERHPPASSLCACHLAYLPDLLLF